MELMNIIEGPVGILSIPEVSEAEISKDLDYLKANSLIFNLLSVGNKHHYLVFLGEWGLDFERNYKNTNRCGRDNPSLIKQTNLDHIIYGLQLLEEFKINFKEVLPPDTNWDSIQWGWLMHDVGEWGMDFDITSDLKHDEVVTSDDLTEQQKALKIMNGISDQKVRTLSISSYMELENRRTPNAHGSFSLEGNIVRFIDKLDPCRFMLDSGVWADWFDAGSRDIPLGIHSTNFQKILNPAEIINTYLVGIEGKKVLRSFLKGEIGRYREDEALKARLNGTLENLCRNLNRKVKKITK